MERNDGANIPEENIQDGLDGAKVIAIFLMLANHVLLAFPDYRVFGFLLGRPCIPIFAYILVARLASDGKSRTVRIMRRLLIWGVLAQLPYALLFDAFEYKVNVLIMLTAGAGLIFLQKNRKKFSVFLAIIFVFIAGPYWDGGPLIPLSMLLAYILYRKNLRVCASIVIVAAASVANGTGPFGLEAIPAVVLAIPIIHLSQTLGKKMPRIPGALFYGFYPAHLFAIWKILGPYRM